MNERIRERMVQVGFTQSDLEHGRNEMLIELVELIVKDCAMIGDYAHLGSVVKPGEMIKEYFGVES